jgi:YqaJ-like viral recombinase domain
MTYFAVTADQRTDAWHVARLGRLTGTCAADMLATIKSGEAAARRNLRTRLVCERLTGIATPTFLSADMKWGVEHEDAARRAYEALTGELVETVGFLQHPHLAAGCSPDGLIAPDGILEVKCPLSATHLEYLRLRAVPKDYLAQCRHNLWISEARWCDFVSYDPRFPQPLQLMVTRVTMSDAERKAYELLVRMFLAEVDREYAEVAAMMTGVAA